MIKPGSMRGLEEFGRVRRSPSFFLRDFLYSEISAIHGVPNIPDDPDLAVEAGRGLCSELLEPLRKTFGGLNIRSGYRSAALNDFGNRNKLNGGRRSGAPAGNDNALKHGFCGAKAKARRRNMNAFIRHMTREVERMEDLQWGRG